MTATARCTLYVTSSAGSVELVEWALESGGLGLNSSATQLVCCVILGKFPTLLWDTVQDTVTSWCLSCPPFHGQHLHLFWRAALGPPESTLSMCLAGPESPRHSL